MAYPSPGRDKILRALLSSCVARTSVRVPAPAALPLASLYALSKRVGVAYSWVHSTLLELESRGWIATKPRIAVLDAPALFAWWGANRTNPKVHGFHVADAPKALRAIWERKPEEGSLPASAIVTTYYAENAFQGHLFPRRMDAYIRAEHLNHAKRVLFEGGAQLGGTNFRLWTGDDAILAEAWFAKPDETWPRYAPVPQVILDLITEGGSAREAADMLIERAFPRAHARLR